MAQWMQVKTVQIALKMLFAALGHCAVGQHARYPNALRTTIVMMQTTAQQTAVLALEPAAQHALILPYQTVAVALQDLVAMAQLAVEGAQGLLLMFRAVVLTSRLAWRF